MKWVLSAVAALLATAPALAQTPDEVSTDPSIWEVCNETSFILRAATGTTGADGLRLRGWDRIRPGDCNRYRTLPEAPRYVLAESVPAHSGGIREWKGDAMFCAGEGDFETTDPANCRLQELDSRPYLRVSAEDRRTILVEPEDYGKRARTAGLQRLLRDAGYKVSRIDGLSGRRTTRLLRTFRKDRDLEAGLPERETLDALEEAARERRETLGLNVCNSTEERVWAAVGYQADGNWHSRGWWPIARGDCAQLLDRPLDAMSAHLFALREDTDHPEPDPDDPEPAAPPPPKPDLRLRAGATPAQFCISEARFASLGRDQCRDRGYAPASFRPLPTDEEGVKVTLTDADFAPAARGGLRR